MLSMSIVISSHMYNEVSDDFYLIYDHQIPVTRCM